jgi:hypothetical protein
MSLDPRIETIFEEIRKLKAEVGTIKSLLQKILNPEGKIDLNMTIEEMIVNIKNAGKITYDVNTTNAEGRIMFCALKDLERKPFGWSDLARALDDRGWHMADGTLSNTLAKLTPKGLLIVEGAKGTRTYRPPSKVTFTGEEL